MTARALGRWARAVLGTAIALAGSVPAGAARDDPYLVELRAGYRALEQGELEQALAHYRAALGAASGDERRFQATLGLAAALDGLGEGEEACERYTEARDLRPEAAEVRRLRVAACAAAGRTADALRELDWLLERDPGDVDALRDLVVLAAAADRHARAAAAARTLVAMDPADLEARMGLAVALYHLNRLDAAIVEFEAVVDADPDHARARYGLGVAALYAGRRDAAVEQYAALKQAAPELAADLYARIFP